MGVLVCEIQIRFALLQKIIVAACRNQSHTSALHYFQSLTAMLFPDIIFEDIVAIRKQIGISDCVQSSASLTASFQSMEMIRKLFTHLGCYLFGRRSCFTDQGSKEAYMLFAALSYSLVSSSRMSCMNFHHQM